MTKTPRLPKLSMLPKRVSVLGRLPSADKQTAVHYGSPGHKAWRRAVMERAGWQCEAIENGQRCQCRAPTHRLFADHKVEIRDNPALALDLGNGQCICGHHHSLKTVKARTARAGR